MKGAMDIMWIIVFFDLPVQTPFQRKEATRFRNFLLNDGFLMLQFSVYARSVRVQDSVERHINRTIANLPKAGSVRALQVTDKQFARMKILIGTQSLTEESNGQLLLQF